MPVTVQEWKDRLKTLPVMQRAELAQFLIESIDNEEDPNAVAAWAKELARHVADIKAGKVEGIPADEVFARLREKHP